MVPRSRIGILLALGFLPFAGVVFAAQPAVLPASVPFVPLPSCRLVDTRLVGGPMVPGEIRSFQVDGEATGGRTT